MKEDKKTVSETEMKSNAAKLGISEKFYRLLRGRGLDDGSIPSFCVLRWRIFRRLSRFTACAPPRTESAWR